MLVTARFYEKYVYLTTVYNSKEGLDKCVLCFIEILLKYLFVSLWFNNVRKFDKILIKKNLVQIY